MSDRIALAGHARDVLDVRSDAPPTLALHTRRVRNLVHPARGITDQFRCLL